MRQNATSDTAQPLHIKQLSLGSAILLHLAPGIAVTAGYAAFAAIVALRDLPNIVGLMLAILIVEAPLLLWLMRRRSINVVGHVDWRWILPWRQANPIWIYPVVGVPIVILSVVVIAAITPWLGNPIFVRFFSRLPEWFVMRPDPAMFTGMSAATMWLVWGGALLALTLVGGVIQEVYFRGFLLPRLEKFGAWGPVLNAGLFAVYHFASPWSWPGFFIMVLPWAYIVRRRRSLQLGIFIHVGMLMVQTLMMGLVLLGFVRLPGG